MSNVRHLPSERVPPTASCDVWSICPEWLMWTGTKCTRNQHAAISMLMQREATLTPQECCWLVQWTESLDNPAIEIDDESLFRRASIAGNVQALFDYAAYDRLSLRTAYYNNEIDSMRLQFKNVLGIARILLLCCYFPEKAGTSVWAGFPRDVLALIMDHVMPQGKLNRDTDWVDMIVPHHAVAFQFTKQSQQSGVGSFPYCCHADGVCISYGVDNCPYECRPIPCVNYAFCQNKASYGRLDLQRGMCNYCRICFDFPLMQLDRAEMCQACGQKKDGVIVHETCGCIVCIDCLRDAYLHATYKHDDNKREAWMRFGVYRKMEQLMKCPACHYIGRNVIEFAS